MAVDMSMQQQWKDNDGGKLKSLEIPDELPWDQTKML
jgi:hypothetical protein